MAKSYWVTFKHSVNVIVPDDATEDQIGSKAVKIHNSLELEDYKVDKDAIIDIDLYKTDLPDKLID